jgi:hypothetical protein
VSESECVCVRERVRERAGEGERERERERERAVVRGRGEGRWRGIQTDSSRDGNFVVLLYRLCQLDSLLQQLPTGAELESTRPVPVPFLVGKCIALPPSVLLAAFAPSERDLLAVAGTGIRRGSGA